MPQPKSAPRPDSGGRVCSSNALPGSMRFQLKTPGQVHRPSVTSSRGPPSAMASSAAINPEGRTAVQMRW